MYHFFYKKEESSEIEYCFNIETSEPLTAQEGAVLQEILADGFIVESINKQRFSG